MSGTKGAGKTPAAPRQVAMVTTAAFANPATNSGREGGSVEPGETIQVDPFYGQDLHLAGLATPADQSDFDAVVEEAGERPSPHAGGIRVTRTRA